MIISIDPGPHTGIAIYYSDHAPGHEFEFGTLDFTNPKNDNYAYLYDFLSTRVVDGDTIVCEKFEYQREKAQNRAHLNYEAAEYVGVVKCWVQINGDTHPNVKLAMQSPSLAVGDKCFWKDDKLKQIGLHLPGRTRRHERDAARHLLYHVSFTLKDNTFINKLRLP